MRPTDAATGSVPVFQAYIYASNANHNEKNGKDYSGGQHDGLVYFLIGLPTGTELIQLDFYKFSRK
jgi:hypothetical protein